MYTPLDYVVHLEAARSSLSRSGQERYARLVGEGALSAQPASTRTGSLMRTLRALAARLVPARRPAAPAPCCPSAAEPA